VETRTSCSEASQSRKRAGVAPWRPGEVCWTNGTTKDTVQGVRHGRRLRVRIDGCTLQKVLHFVSLDLDAWPLYYHVYHWNPSRARKPHQVLVRFCRDKRSGWRPCIRSGRSLGVRIEFDAGFLPSGLVIAERHALDNKEIRNGAKKANGRNAQVLLTLRVAEGTDVRDGGDQDRGERDCDAGQDNGDGEALP